MQRPKFFFLSLSILLAALIFAFLYNLSAIPIRMYDEARLANSALEMHLYGNWLIPHYDGSPDMWSTKPPFMIWLQTIFMKIIGVNEWAVRLPSALSSIAIGLSIFFFSLTQTKKFANALVSGLVFATSFAFVYPHAGRTGDYDAPLVLFMLLYSLSIYQYCLNSRPRNLLAFFLFLILAVFTKGIAGLLFIPGIAIYLLIKKRFTHVLRTKEFYGGIAAFILLIGGYYLLREQLNPGYLKTVWENELGGRYLSTIEKHDYPFSFYLENFRTWRYSYWFYFLVPAFIIGLMSNSTRKLTIFNLVICLPYLIIISTAKTKLEWYDLPLYPFFAMQIGSFIMMALDKLPFRNSRTKPVFISLGLLLIFAYPSKQVYDQVVHFKEKPWDVEAHQPAWFLKEAIDSNLDINNIIVIYKGYPAHIDFYLRKLNSTGRPADRWDKLEHLQTGMLVLVNQDVFKREIESYYNSKILEEKYGCTLYRIENDAAN